MVLRLMPRAFQKEKYQMNILILNGSPRPNGDTKKMINAFTEAASGHKIDVIDVCRKNIHGCLACEYCHTKGGGRCIQQDDMQEVSELLAEAEMLVIASPIYYHNLSGQLKCAIDRIYALDKPAKLKRIAMFLSSGSGNMYDGAKFSYDGDFLDYLKLEGMGIFTNHDENVTEKISEMAASLR